MISVFVRPCWRRFFVRSRVAVRNLPREASDPPREASDLPRDNGHPPRDWRITPKVLMIDSKANHPGAASRSLVFPWRPLVLPQGPPSNTREIQSEFSLFNANITFSDFLIDFLSVSNELNLFDRFRAQTSLGGFLFDLIDFGPKLVWVDFCLIWS